MTHRLISMQELISKEMRSYVVRSTAPSVSIKHVQKIMKRWLEKRLASLYHGLYLIIFSWQEHEHKEWEDIGVNRTTCPTSNLHHIAKTTLAIVARINGITELTINCKPLHQKEQICSILFRQRQPHSMRSWTTSAFLSAGVNPSQISKSTFSFYFNSHSPIKISWNNSHHKNLCLRHRFPTIQLSIFPSPRCITTVTQFLTPSTQKRDPTLDPSQ